MDNQSEEALGTGFQQGPNSANGSGSAGTQQSNMNVPKPGINNGNQFKKAGNIQNMMNAANTEDPDQRKQNLKNAGKDVLKPIVRPLVQKAVQAATGGAVGSDPATKKILEKAADTAVDKVAETGAIDHAVESVSKIAEKGVKVKKAMQIYAILSSLGPGFFLIIILIVIIGYLFMPVYGEDDHTNASSAEKKFYQAIDDINSDYNAKCGSYPNADLIETTIFYPQMVAMANSDFEYFDDEENLEDYSSNMSNINFSGKSSVVSQLYKVLYPNIDESSEDEENKNKICEADYDGYYSYLINTYVPSSDYMTILSEYGPVDIVSAVNEVFGIAGAGTSSDTSNSDSGSSGNIITGAGVAGAVPTVILENSQNPLGAQPTVHTSCYGFYSATNCTSHTGVDLSSSNNPTYIYSIADGVIENVVKNAVHCTPDWKNGKACSVCSDSAGNRVTIKHTVVDEDGNTVTFYSQYLHLASVDPAVVYKASVSKGQKIGVMGNTGCSSAAHLHFNLLSGSKLRYNPEELLVYVGVKVKSDCEAARKKCKG